MCEEVSAYDPASPGVDGVFISHAHFDHIQDLSFIDPAIPVYCTKETKIIAKAITDVSATKVDQQFYQLRRKQQIVSKDLHFKTLLPGELEYKDVTEDPKPEILDPKTGYTFTHEYTPEYRKFKTTTMTDQIKGIKYEMIPVDHSIPGACSVILELPEGKRILYTGDLRFQGNTGMTIDEYTAAVGDPVHYMIVEGTRVDSDEILSEDSIKDEIRADIHAAEGLVLIDFGWKDISRFNIIYEATVAENRVLVIQPKLAYLLYELYKSLGEPYKDPRKMNKMKVYLKREDSYLYSEADYDKFKMGYLHWHGRNSALKDKNIVRIAEKLGTGGRPTNEENTLPDPVPDQPYKYQETYDLAVHHLKNGIKAYEIQEKPQNYVLMFSYWDTNELFDLIPMGDVDHKTKYIKAATSPFNDEMVIDESKFIKWLDYFKVQYDSEIVEGKKLFKRRHISGHASKPELKELITKINPEKIIPIHTEHPEIFKQLFQDKYLEAKYNDQINL
jgi:ribonuclease J